MTTLRCYPRDRPALREYTVDVDHVTLYTVRVWYRALRRTGTSREMARFALLGVIRSATGQVA